MAKQPAPARPRRADERQYESDIRRTFLNPIFAQLRARLAQAEAANQAWAAMEDVFRGVAAQPREGVPLDEIRRNLERMEGYNREQVKRAFRSALGVNILPLLAEGPVRVFLEARISDNVSLIRTIPTRAHEGLKKRLREHLYEHPFDQNALMKMLRDEYQSSGYNVRRLTRDQTSKLTGQLNQIRQQQLGVTGYRWMTSNDERVRPTHVANSFKVFRWDSPSPETGHPGHDIQCRCVARALILASDRERLKSILPAA